MNPIDSIKQLSVDALEVRKKEGLRKLLEAGIPYLVWEALGPIMVSSMTRRIENQGMRIRDIESAVNFSLSFSHLGLTIRPCQVREEITSMLKEVNGIKLDRILEIGTALGGTLFLLSRLASENALIISIDLPGGPFGRGYQQWKTRLYRSFARGDQDIQLIRKDSHNEETLQIALRTLGGRKLDFLLIDGDHSYQGVRRDFEMYSQLVRDGGMIAFHDIIPHVRPDAGVHRFWAEIKGGHNTVEIVQNPNQGWGGIGLIRV